MLAYNVHKHMHGGKLLTHSLVDPDFYMDTVLQSVKINQHFHGI